jgi:hypothetical protein
MATMYHVRVQSVEGDRLTCRVTAAYPDEPLLPSWTLAFRFVWEPWWDLADGVTQHLPEEAQPVTVEEARARGRAAPLAHELGGRDMNDLDWNRANASSYIACVGVRDHSLCEAPSPEAREWDGLPQATYLIAATDPRWLAHLTPGMAWETTAFDDDGMLDIHPGLLTADVVAIARGIDNDQAFERLPILADALEEAGCEDADILGHCRGPGPHVPGCRVLDLVLGKI